MKTEWDYTALADAYLKRPDYAVAAIDAMLAIAGAKRGDKVCDVGAGVAHLTLMLAERGFQVAAVEPNDAMRANGTTRTEQFTNVSWHEGTGESTGQPEASFDLVTFGSSFNVCDRQQALEETVRILRPHGWFACMWNHRKLDDPIQAEIEKTIRSYLPQYGYGSRREDQAEVISRSGLFGSVVHIDSSVVHKQTIDECVEAWRSHATLERQAGSTFTEIVSAISQLLREEVSDDKSGVIEIPYSTNIWIAQAK